MMICRTLSRLGLASEGGHSVSMPVIEGTSDERQMHVHVVVHAKKANMMTMCNGNVLMRFLAS